MAPVPVVSAWRAWSTWKVGRPVDVDTYDHKLEPLSETLNTSTSIGALSHVAVAKVGVLPACVERDDEV